jgi:hypothetical protein
MSEKKLSNEEILKIVEQFESLSDQEKEKLMLGQGVDKVAYDVPGTDFVLKTPNPKAIYRNQDLVSDYFNSKKLSKHVPVETPILVTRPDKEPVQLQRKIQTLPPDLSYPDYKDSNMSMDEIRADMKQRRSDFKANDRLHPFLQQLDKAGILEGDVHRQNVGIDKQGQTKLLDVGKFWLNDEVVPDASIKNEALMKAREIAEERIGRTLKNPRIYRSVIPALTGAAGLLASGVSEASDAEELGNTNEQEALLREVDAQRQMKEIGQTQGVPDDVKLEALKLFKKNKLPF